MLYQGAAPKSLNNELHIIAQQPQQTNLNGRIEIGFYSIDLNYKFRKYLLVSSAVGLVVFGTAFSVRSSVSIVFFILC